jgi:tetratricopeptide (TPR) repeat protein
MYHFGKILKASDDTSDIMPEAYMLAAESCRSIEQYEKAIKYYHIIVDNWPNYKSAYHCQFMTGRIYEELKIKGEIDAEAAEPLIRAAYEKMVSNYPNCAPAGLASMWLTNHPQKTSQ